VATTATHTRNGDDPKPAGPEAFRYLAAEVLVPLLHQPGRRRPKPNHSTASESVEIRIRPAEITNDSVQRGHGSSTGTSAKGMVTVRTDGPWIHGAAPDTQQAVYVNLVELRYVNEYCKFMIGVRNHWSSDVTTDRVHVIIDRVHATISQVTRMID
jgi:hypothetical protein